MHAGDKETIIPEDTIHSMTWVSNMGKRDAVKTVQYKPSEQSNNWLHWYMKVSSWDKASTADMIDGIFHLKEYFSNYNKFFRCCLNY